MNFERYISSLRIQQQLEEGKQIIERNDIRNRLLKQTELPKPPPLLLKPLLSRVTPRKGKKMQVSNVHLPSNRDPRTTDNR